MTIWKFIIPGPGRQIIEMPALAQVLSTALQDENLCIWALVDPGVPREKRIFYVEPTGSDLSFSTDPKQEPLHNHPSEATFVGSVFRNLIVFHVFDGGVK